ncbi:response regulator [Devosia rhizoryzae]|uniref:Response regulator n=1 Tax=Devosia rhizoryzae TaxID=2774137 RepID=A0ABX7C9V8_9HYPH|nr:response regulator [Devosia rhizoryzae]QQR38741.1 response regulator [Devosia rhizoryzae]
MILVVEDEAMVAILIEEALTDAGYEVALAYNGPAAMQSIDTQIDDMDALITDVRLGGPITGWDVAKHARELSPEVPVIYASGDSSGDWRRHGVEGSIMLTKPYSMDRILALVTQLVSSVQKQVPLAAS